MSRRLLFFCVLAALAAPRGSAGPRAGGDPWKDFDVLHYDLAVRFDPGKEAFSGTVGIQALRRTTSRTMLLHASNPALTIDSLNQGSARLPYLRRGELLMVKFPAAGPAGDTVRLSVSYHGTSTFKGEYDNGGVFFSRDSAGATHIATIAQPNFARRWWPCKDLPDDKATATVTVTVPRPLTAVSNGLLKKVSEGKKERTFRWETRYPTSTYLVSVAAAPYKEFSETYTGINGATMPIRYYVFAHDLAKAKRDFRNTASILRYFAETFCEYPFLDEKFGYAEVDGSLTMENQTIVSVERRLVTGDGANETTLIHETSHHWWGDLITPATWNHTWLSEGFATLAEGLYLEHTQGTAAYRRYMDGLMGARLGSFAGSVIGKTDTAFWDSFSPRVYVKGAIVLHMLRGLLGDSVFFPAVRAYLNDPALRYGNATTEDFARSCERISGRDLGWFFSQWVYATTDSVDRPRLRLAWEADTASATRAVRVTVEQTNADKLLYRLPMNITVAWDGGTKAFPVVDSLARQSFRFELPGAPTSVVLDKEHAVFFDLQP
jgi:aminopeptidase N